jgi:MFS family permease
LAFALAVSYRSYEWAVVARVVFGVGESTMMVVQGAIVSQWFRGAELALAIGVTECLHALGNWLGKVSVNFGVACGGWEATLWIGLAMCGLGCAVTILFWFEEKRAEAHGNLAKELAKREASEIHCSPGCVRELGGVRHMSGLFWLLVLLHFLVSNGEHLFDSVSADFIKESGTQGCRRRLGSPDSRWPFRSCFHLSSGITWTAPRAECSSLEQRVG